MSKTILVKAAPLPDPGLAGKARVVKEHTTKRYIFEHEAVEVPDTPYYRKKIRKGELLLLVKAEAAPPVIAPPPPKPLADDAFDVSNAFDEDSNSEDDQ